MDPKGPASQAGLLGTRRSLGGVVAGDVILDMGGKRIQGAADVDACLDSYSIGDAVSVKLRRAINGVRFSCITPFQYQKVALYQDFCVPGSPLWSYAVCGLSSSTNMHVHTSCCVGLQPSFIQQYAGLFWSARGTCRHGAPCSNAW
ncbi:MAG: PDZ domain-containing protein [Akkermansiaceae bacterium]|nr:PDZ domain-containing protein [Akkermansiaceae bacterium]